ncbi:MAG: lactate racemase domain-containing protein [Firmicutes bacterium]|nr:lactate racemase domain-containing protein [Bacillota bacterium]
MQFTEMVLVRQQLVSEKVGDINCEIESQLCSPRFIERLRGRKKIALAVGSRGIASLPLMVKATIGALKKIGLTPYIIPAMGSHGGATAGGQVETLKSLGINEESCGMPVLCSMETAYLGETPEKIPCFTAKDAVNAEGIIILNRIKPHTAMTGPMQSGLCKMLAVGLGREKGAQAAHAHGLDRSVRALAQMLIDRLSVVAGIAVVENGRHEVAQIKIVPPEEFMETDRTLLQKACAYMPRIPYNQADILLIEEIGKDISGSGMDINIIGKWRRDGGKRQPNYHRIIVLDLSAKTGGNGVGIGFADFTTEAVVARLDRKATYANALAAGVTTAGKIPVYGESDEVVLQMAMQGMPADRLNIIHIRNTLNLEEFGVSKNLWESVSRPRDLAGIACYDLETSAKGQLVRLDRISPKNVSLCNVT